LWTAVAMVAGCWTLDAGRWTLVAGCSRQRGDSSRREAGETGSSENKRRSAGPASPITVLAAWRGCLRRLASCYHDHDHDARVGKATMPTRLLLHAACTPAQCNLVHAVARRPARPDRLCASRALSASLASRCRRRSASGLSRCRPLAVGASSRVEPGPCWARASLTRLTDAEPRNGTTQRTTQLRTHAPTHPRTLTVTDMA
jgi:hypothetical protein